MKSLALLRLRWQRFWCLFWLETEQQQLAAYTQSVQRGTEMLAHLDFQIAQKQMPQSLIMQAINRSAK